MTTGGLLQCVRCPVAYHADRCACAGATFLGGLHIICTRHRVRPDKHVNVSWCLACSQGIARCCLAALHHFTIFLFVIVVC